VSAAFDTAARRYDADFTMSQLGVWLRHRVWQVLEGACQPGQRVLELGCGTGEDAVWLARRGVSVVATDASATMLSVAERKAHQAGVRVRIKLAQVDAARLAVGGTYDAALADFGVLNCVPDRRALGHSLAEHMRPGGLLIAVVMGPLCVWEVAWHVLHADLGRAVRRWRSGALAHIGGVALPVWYPSPTRLRAELAPGFTLRRLVGLGTLLPPSYLSHLVDRWPRVFSPLARLDGRVPFGAWLADHYVAVFERR
jgi:2-polyprenyl-3-methyl-5-hydroxy-6-metoxy-1,4-benzoquinol methylase